ncbi:MAG TPA: deoxyguanosinetriphosphate triphosphohydrolase [Phycisphaerae bacterium]|nr:deoxyguanosinetriphosphate triphosphohydrolase [Phycisphaerae bacterium]
MTNARPNSRAEYETWEKQWLASCAVCAADAGGRRHADPEHPYRTCFQRDRDRIVHSSAFRRLDFKTQVFVPHEDDHFRTRLTHTLEVSQVGRTLGRALRLNEDLIEAVALGHDLGHPPFGHGGEEELDALMASRGGFEHNRQSLRIVDYLEHPYPQFRGLNLTRVVRECLARHETRYDVPICDEFDRSLQAPLEGQIVDLADEIAYTAADLEDALAAGWIRPDELSDLALWRRGWDDAERSAPEARPIHKRIRACKAALSALADDLIATTRHHLREANVRSHGDVRRAGRRCVALSAETKQALDEMQGFLLEHVYRDPRNVEQEQASRALMRELFSALVAGPHLLPTRYRQRIESDGLDRVVCDYVAGMTDRFCEKEHARACR